MQHKNTALDLHFKRAPTNWQLNLGTGSLYLCCDPWISGGISARGLIYESTASIHVILRASHHRQINAPFLWLELTDRVVCRSHGPWLCGKQVGRKRTWETSRLSRRQPTEDYLGLKTKLKSNVNNGHNMTLERTVSRLTAWIRCLHVTHQQRLHHPRAAL